MQNIKTYFPYILDHRIVNETLKMEWVLEII